jgi:hypothetical protein
MMFHSDKDFYCGPQGYDTVQFGSCVGATIPEQNADPNIRASFPTLSDYLRTHASPNPWIIF